MDIMHRHRHGIGIIDVIFWPENENNGSKKELLFSKIDTIYLSADTANIQQWTRLSEVRVSKIDREVGMAVLKELKRPLDTFT